MQQGVVCVCCCQVRRADQRVKELLYRGLDLEATMEGMTGVIPESWKRVKKGRLKVPYERINRRGGKGRPVKVKTERLGKRSWRFKMPKIKIRILSPITLLARLRDAYVRMMMNIAGRGRMPGLAYGFGPNAGFLKPPPARKREILTDAEILCLEYLKRDTNFLIAAAKAHAQATQ
ncbi:hypothetical protein MARPO_0010s0032 [Marchantia polymorpha]|uniref:Uncharacterized protein n=1 Tax=Marchantia polymorpha TaxID=3197 RepID=A0A2R6XKL9_MARPO|nr:hypothetical protein MARPO_0010s0032 [Marchantia polymorpha]|eukprot:PTQ46621.1 hypothetical protein MARPO_0010s0032 [Marchantia polymorpha]